MCAFSVHHAELMCMLTGTVQLDAVMQLCLGTRGRKQCWQSFTVLTVFHRRQQQIVQCKMCTCLVASTITKFLVGQVHALPTGSG